MHKLILKCIYKNTLILPGTLNKNTWEIMESSDNLFTKFEYTP